MLKYKQEKKKIWWKKKKYFTGKENKIKKSK